MIDDPSANLGDYLSLLRRRVALIVLVAAIGAVIGALASGYRSSRYEASSTLVVEDAAGALALAMGSPMTTSSVHVAPLVQQADSPTFTDGLVDAAVKSRAHLDIFATGDDQTAEVILTVTGTESAPVAELLSKATDKLRSSRRDSVIASIGPLKAVLTSRRDSASARIATLDGLLGSVQPSAQTAVDLTRDRVAAQAELDSSRASLAAIDLFEKQGDGGVRVVATDAPQRAHPGSRPLGGLIGFGVGALLVVGGLVVWRFVRFPVDSRGAIERCGTRCVAVLGETEGDAVVQAAVRRVEARSLSVIEIGDVPAGTFARIFGKGGNNDNATVTELAQLQPGGSVLAVVRSGAREDEVRAMVMNATSIGATVVGAVLVGVADRGVAEALSR